MLAIYISNPEHEFAGEGEGGEEEHEHDKSKKAPLREGPNFKTEELWTCLVVFSGLFLFLLKHVYPDHGEWSGKI